MGPVRLLRILTPPVFSYYSNRILNGTVEQVDEIWHIGSSECAVFGIIFGAG